MDGRFLEYLFLCSSSVSIAVRAFHFLPIIAYLYLAFILFYWLGWLKLQPVRGAMVFSSPLSVYNAFLYVTVLLSRYSYAQSGSASATVVINGTTSTFRPIFTVPASADEGATLLPNIVDPQAVDAQTVCPGYKALNVLRTKYGVTATLSLAGPACNVYGTDIDTLNLTVQYQSADRLSVRIVPAVIDSSNTSQYILPNNLIYQPTVDVDANVTSLENDLSFTWSNEPTFSFTISRLSTGDTLFSTYGNKLVFENQFIEFASPLPENYNLYGLGETIHALRLGNNFTKTIYAADVGDPIDT